MARQGMMEPERQVRWLRIPAGGYCRVTVTSPIYSYRRHWGRDGPERCPEEGCPKCAEGVPWRARYVMKVEAEDGEWMLELGAPQYGELCQIEENGGMLGAVLELRRERRGKTAKIEVYLVDRKKPKYPPEDLLEFVRSVEANLEETVRRRR